jgi:threonine dehydratase
MLPDLDDIQTARRRIESFIHKTPVLSSRQLNGLFGCDLFFKCENFQKTGAFKFRGATNAVMLLTENEKRGGVVTHSSGNHASALALAARNRGVVANIVMPVNASLVKKNAAAGYGARITFCQPTLQDRETTAGKIIEKTGGTLIHPYDNINIICGQGTAALELLEEKKNIEIVVAPVGGGGLLSGTSVSVKGISKQISVVGAEPANADDAYLSLKKGELVPSVNPRTIADGLLTSLSELTYSIIRRNVDHIFLAGEQSIIDCMKLVWERMKIIIEPSSAVTLAVIKDNPEFFRSKRVGVIISGGNVDLTKLPF